MFATLHTTAGDIRIELYPNHAPRTVQNFTGLATGTTPWTDPTTGEERTDPLYNGVVFHRVISGFMIQGGDPLGTGRGGPGYTFDDEIHPELSFNEPYLLAMANAGKRLDPTTGKVADDQSRAIVDAIENTRVRPGDRPVEDIVINSITIED